MTDVTKIRQNILRLKAATSVPISEKTVVPVSYSKRGWNISSIDSKNLEKEYYQNPVLHAIINTKASLESNAKIFIRNIKNKEIISLDRFQYNSTKDQVVKKMFRLINNPNPLQSRKEFFALNSIFKDVFGNAFFYANSANNINVMDVEFLWNVWPQFMTPKTTGKYFDQIDINGILKQWDWSWNGYSKKFSSEEILHRKEPNLTLRNNDDLVLGKSKQVSLQLPLNNIIIAYVSRNEIATNKGMMGIISSNRTDGNMGSIILEDDEKTEVQNDLSGYGILPGQQKWLVTKHNIKYQAIDQDVRKLGLLNEIVSDTKIVCHEYGLHPLLIQMEQRGATFENQKIAERSSYQNTIIPEFEDKIEDLNVWLKTRDYGWEYVSSYKHIPSAQIDEKERSETVKNLNTVYKDQFLAGKITYNEWAIGLGEEKSDNTWGDKRIFDMTLEEIQKIKGNFSINDSLEKTNVQ
jgi:hypothetical protein